MPEEKARALDYAIFNVWQPTVHPVESAPLALLDWTSIDMRDVHKVSLGYEVTPKGDNHNENYPPPIAQPTHNNSHRWYFFPNLQLDEALIFTQVDARRTYPTHSFHTAVRHNLVDNPRPRSSIETRILCGFRRDNNSSKM